MLRELTKEEKEEGEARLAELRASPSTEDRIVAILMDSSVGGFGSSEKMARAKADEILLLLGHRGR